MSLMGDRREQTDTKKIGYVVRYWPTVSETFVAREIEELQRRGFCVEVAAIGQRTDARMALPSDTVVWRPPGGLSSAVLIPPMRTLARSEVRDAVRFASRHLRPKDVVRALWVAERGALCGWSRLHVHFAGEAAEWAMIAATVLSVPLTVTVHAVDLFVPRPSLPEVLRRAARVITICEHHRQWLASHYAIDAAVVRCGVPTDVPRADPGAAGARFICVARDVPKKGLDALVSAIGETAGATLRLVSDAHRLGGPRVLTGPLRPDRIAAVLARAHCFALPCRTAASGDRDGIPVSLLEAMAASLPVVSTAVSGIPEILDDEVGWLVSPGDQAALCRAIAHAAGDSRERERRGRAARARIVERGLTVAAQVDGLLSVWGEGCI